MPLVRFQVRNEYGLGQPQLYKDANREDPKAVLDGVAVAGLVGILRQLGDLAEFAAEVFHGLQEQVTTTASRSHKLMVRVQHIEVALPPLEKAVLAQTSHIHFAYTAGLEWHPRIRSERHHFIYNDLPRFIMDSYEECSDPPRLHLLDKFDTGGPGSCLKRYSDPTFFKRASAIPDEANAEKLQRDRKAQRSKKKGSQHNGDISHSASISNRSNRMQPISSNVNGQSSPSQTVSTTDMAALKSDLENNSNSFGSRTESGYYEYVAHSSSSLQAKPQEYKESPTSESVHHDDTDTIESVLHYGEIVFVDGNSPGSSLQDQVTSGSSCGKWDEKAEIVDPTGQQKCLDETTEMLPTMGGVDAHEGRVGDSRSIQPKDYLFDGENILEPSSSRNQNDEIESEPDEPDAFMDALNTIESESENDLECQTKREVKPVPTFVNKEGPDGMHEITIDCMNPQTPRFESRSATSHISPEREMPVHIPNSASLESPVPEQIPQVTIEPSKSNQYVGSDRTDILDDSRLETVDCDSAPSGSVTTTVQDKIISGLCEPQDSPSDVSRSNSINFWTGVCEPQDSPADMSRSNSINFWTNGGMLGLEPSKPPDFSMASPVNPASRSTAETVDLSNHAYKLMVDEHETGPSMLTTDDRCNDKGQEDGISSETISKGVSPMESYTELVNIGDSNKSNGFGQAMEDSWKRTNTMEPGNVLPVAPYTKSASNELNQENDENSSRVFGLGRRLLENGFGRNVTFDKFEPASYLNADELKQKSEHQRVVYQSFPDKAFQEQSEDGFAVRSSPFSPPLEHMKISFQPLNGIETSKLKLKLSDGNQSHGSVRDMFQSFQLIPEPAVPLHEFGSDSDDDTFCRSSPYISDDCVSHHSESNSEQWESSATPERDNRELYDALRGISSVEHISSSPELGEIASNAIYSDGGIKSVHSEDGLVQYLSDPLLDLPSLDAFKPVLLQEPKDVSALMDVNGLRCPVESTPGPPPLPPVEWCLSKPQFDATEESQDVSEGFKRVLNTGLLGSITFQQPPLKQQVNEVPVCIKPKFKQNQQVNEHKEADQALNSKEIDADQALNGKEIDENDFLQQIRAQSFNLRRTVTSKPTTNTPGPATHVKVTAILEKANAIRQAVGSDDGDDDDDTWSDT